MKCDYARVSNIDKKLVTQTISLKDSGAEKIYEEKFNDTTTKRPEFEKVIQYLMNSAMLIVTKLDRFARNTRETLETI